MPRTPEQISADARIGAHVSWANTVDRRARTRAATEGQMKRFERQVDPDGTLDPRERAIRAEHARKAYMLQLAKKSARVRAARKAS